ncbi:hypothetical protein D0469_09595 [Peribacillus saganii]|uniref:Lipoprotein n=1 Tax=Peribacillus saganii TaxID=2303992 RepID=A0A372LR26_9BACI|nr:hypothetical protein [Peribacillus saganii]RFU69462.1 hypothetical protein D0469_09595 [Peribacillus saganii]
MGKLKITAAAFMILLGMAACSPDKEKMVNEGDKNNPSVEKIKAKSEEEPKNNKQLTEKGGLGDTRKTLEKIYGENKGDVEIARFQDDFLIVTFEDHRAVNVQLQYEAKGDERPSEEEVLSDIKERIPKDALEVDRYKEEKDSIQEIIEYESDLLKEEASEYSFRDDEAGTFSVTLERDDQGIVLATLALGRGSIE